MSFSGGFGGFGGGPGVNIQFGDEDDDLEELSFGNQRGSNIFEDDDDDDDFFEEEEERPRKPKTIHINPHEGRKH